MLLFSRRFLPFFITQFGGAFTDNLYKNALLVYLTLRLSDSKTLSFYTNLSMALFIFPMFLFSAWSGLLADRFEKRFLIVRIKWLEVFIMAVGIIAFVFDLIPLMAGGGILPYLDIPLQHASPRILKAMRRPGNRERTLERIRRWREICPDLALRSTFIVGFPGETEADFEELLAFIEEADINRAGCFAYSPVEGAAANALPDQIPEDIKQERLQRFMAAQEAVSARLLAEKIGSVLPVLIDEVDADTLAATGRTPYDAPEIDGVVHISDIDGAKPGDIVHVEIEDSDAHDLYGRVY